MRLDRASLSFLATIAASTPIVLGLLASGAILIGRLCCRRLMRASAEIVPDRTARPREAAIHHRGRVFYDRGFERELTRQIIE